MVFITSLFGWSISGCVSFNPWESAPFWVSLPPLSHSALEKKYFGPRIGHQLTKSWSQLCFIIFPMTFLNTLCSISDPTVLLEKSSDGAVLYCTTFINIVLHLSIKGRFLMTSSTLQYLLVYQYRLSFLVICTVICCISMTKCVFFSHHKMTLLCVLRYHIYLFTLFFLFFYLLTFLFILYIMWSLLVSCIFPLKCSTEFRVSQNWTSIGNACLVFQ